MASLTYPDATTVQYAPNALGQPTQVSGFASSVAYYPNGAIAGYTLSNGVVHRMQQNLRQLPADWQDGDIVHDVYEYDENGNVRSIADLAQGAQHTSTSRTMAPYDGLDRLTQVSGAWGTASYSYDALDNMVTSTLGQRSLTHGYDAANRLTSLSGSQSVGLSYDANGNVTGRGAQIYAFDLGNRLRSAQGLAQYDYDGHGRRTRVGYADGTSRVFLYGQAGQLFYEARSNGVATRHIYLGGKRIAESYSGNRTPTFVYTDALGSTVAIKSANHRLPEQSVYEPYGATAAGFNRNGPGFTGHVNDPDTGLVYMQQRYYDPVAGRFLSVDPVTTNAATGGGFNRYAYALNNPYKYTDPDGRCPIATDGVACSAIYVDSGLKIQNQQLRSALNFIAASADRHLIVYGGPRDEARNAAVGGSKSSLHLKDMAADVIFEGVSKRETASILQTNPARLESGLRLIYHLGSKSGLPEHSHLEYSNKSDSQEKDGRYSPLQSGRQADRSQGSQATGAGNVEFQGVFRVDGILDSKKLEKELK